MKKLTLLLFAIVLVSSVNSQVLIQRDTIYPPKIEGKVTTEAPVKKEQNTKPRVKTLFEDQKSFGGYFGITMGYSEVDNTEGFAAGIRMMFVANHYLGIGFGGKGFVSNATKIPDTNPIRYNNYGGGYGGMYLEPVIFSLKPVHVAMPVLFGVGGAVYSDWVKGQVYYHNTNYINNFFFIVEPGIDVELNIARWFRIGVGATYKFTTPIEGIEESPSPLLNGFNYALTFKMGWF